MNILEKSVLYLAQAADGSPITTTVVVFFFYLLFNMMEAQIEKLISELKKMPQDLEVGYSHGDNAEHEVAGWCNGLIIFDKDEVDMDQIYGSEDQSMLDSMPQRCVVIRG